MTDYKLVQADGQTVEWPLDIRHNSAAPMCQNTAITFSIPSGVRLIGPTAEGSTIILVPKGFYNSVEKKWYYGDLAAGTSLQKAFTIIVDDISLADVDNRFILTATLTSSCPEADMSNNVTALVIEVKDECSQVSLTIESPSSNCQANLSIG